MKPASHPPNMYPKYKQVPSLSPAAVVGPGAFEGSNYYKVSYVCMKDESMASFSPTEDEKLRLFRERRREHRGDAVLKGWPSLIQWAKVSEGLSCQDFYENAAKTFSKPLGSFTLWISRNPGNDPKYTKIDEKWTLQEIAWHYLHHDPEELYPGENMILLVVGGNHVRPFSSVLGSFGRRVLEAVTAPECKTKGRGNLNVVRSALNSAERAEWDREWDLPWRIERRNMEVNERRRWKQARAQRAQEIYIATAKKRADGLPEKKARRHSEVPQSPPSSRKHAWGATESPDRVTALYAGTASSDRVTALYTDAQSPGAVTHEGTAKAKHGALVGTKSPDAAVHPFSVNHHRQRRSSEPPPVTPARSPLPPSRTRARRQQKERLDAKLRLEGNYIMTKDRVLDAFLGSDKRRIDKFRDLHGEFFDAMSDYLVECDSKSRSGVSDESTSESRKDLMLDGLLKVQQEANALWLAFVETADKKRKRKAQLLDEDHAHYMAVYLLECEDKRSKGVSDERTSEAGKDSMLDNLLHRQKK